MTSRQASLYEVQGKTRDDGRIYDTHLCLKCGGYVVYLPNAECIKCGDLTQTEVIIVKETDAVEARQAIASAKERLAQKQTLSGWNAIAAKHAPKPFTLKAFIDCTHPNEYPTMNGMHCKDCGTTRDPIGQFETSLVSKLSPRDSGYVKF